MHPAATSKGAHARLAIAALVSGLTAAGCASSNVAAPNSNAVRASDSCRELRAVHAVKADVTEPTSARAETQRPKSSVLASAGAPPLTTFTVLPPTEPAPRPQEGFGFADVNRSNDPLENSAAFNIQDQYTPDYEHASFHTNDVLLRGTQPLSANSVIPYTQLIRLTVPISTRPDPDGGYETGLGDFELFDIFLLGNLGNLGNVSVGVGPLVTFPTASQSEIGPEKWQAGLAGVGIAKSEAGVFGGLVQWQKSFAGSGDEDVEKLTVQPILIYNLPGAWYLRSTAIWSFDLESGDHYIPVGLGVGKAWRAGNITYNLFAEPQWTVEHEGDFLPQTSLFFGLNMTIGG